jgi:hypothetical protein
MTFKEFLQNEELQGLFGKIKAINPGTLSKRIADKEVRRPKKGTSVGRAFQGEKAIIKTPTPALSHVKQVSLKPPSERKDWFKQPRSKPVRPPLGLLK